MKKDRFIINLEKLENWKAQKLKKAKLPKERKKVEETY